MLLFLYITNRLYRMFFYANVPDNDAKKIILLKHVFKLITLEKKCFCKYLNFITNDQMHAKPLIIPNEI